VSTSDPSADPSLETRVTGPSTPTTAFTASTPSTPLELATTLGRYLPIEELGRGGMGRVLRAYDPKLQREVALKVLHTRSVDPLARARLVREARTMAKLGHPNVVAVHDVDDDPEHGVILAMELVKGSTLREWLREQPRRWPEILAVFVEAGRGLAAAHGEGLLHRDFKPANVLIPHAGPGGRGPCKVTDFGLAKLEHDQGPSTSGARAPLQTSSVESSGEPLTQAGAVIGTTRYMAPEQHFGEALTSAADQFSFCVSLWEALYGELPFSGKTPTELVTNINAGKPRSPTGIGVVPGWLRRACERGLSADPTQRWPSMNALLDALLKGRARAGVRKGLLAAGVLAALGVGIEAQRRFDLAARTSACEATGDEVETAWTPEREQALRDALVATRVSYASTTADKVVPWLERQAVEWRQARVDACLDADVRGQWDAETLDRSLWCLDERRMELESLVDELTRADAGVLHRAASAAAQLGPVTACRDEEVLEALEPPPQQDREPLRAVRADVVRAGNLEQAGRYDQGLLLTRDALARAEALGWSPLVAAARLQLGSLLARSGDYPAAEAELEHAYFEAAMGATSEVAFDAAAALVDIVGLRAARPVEGRRWGRLAEVALLDVQRGEQLRQAILFINIANIDQSVGSLDEAKGRYERALAIMEQALGPQHPDVVGYVSNLATVHAITGDYDAAKVLFERALAIVEQALGPEHPEVASCLTNLANIHASTGAYEEAKVLYERALAIWEPTLGLEHPDVASTLDNLGAVYYLTGAYGEAKQLFEHSLAIGEKTLGPEHPDVASTLDNLANVALAQDRPGDAIPLAQRAVTLRENRAFPAEHLAAARLVLARALWDAPADAGRDRARARSVAEQARDGFRAGGHASELAEADQWLADHPEGP